MPGAIRTAGHALALLLVSLAMFTPADAWVSNARATPTVNGPASPIIITNWTY
jgi:hypothetical protein